MLDKNREVFPLRIRRLMLGCATSIMLMVSGTALTASAATVNNNSLNADRSLSASAASVREIKAVKAGAGAQATVPAYSKDVSARVKCDGKVCGGFNGTVSWEPNYVKIVGIVWGSKSGEAQVYLKWTTSIVEVNKEAGAAPGLSGVGVNKLYYTFEPGYITVTVCSEVGEWHCGDTVDP